MRKLVVMCLVGLAMTAYAGAGAENGNPLTTPWTKGQITVNTAVGINLSQDAVGEPFSVAPDVWYTVSPELQVGLVHSAVGNGGFYGADAGAGLCLSGEENGCPNAYDGFALGGNYWVVKGDINVIPWGRLNVKSLDKDFAGVTGGTKITQALPDQKITIGANPNLYLGFTERDMGNKEFLTIPVHAMYAVSPKLHVGVQTGIAGPLDDIGDFLEIPVIIGGVHMVNQKLMVGGAMAFPNLLGKNSTSDLRQLSIYVTWITSPK